MYDPNEVFPEEWAELARIVWLEELAAQFEPPF